MKKDIALHGSFLVAFLALITVYRGWVEASYISLWIGGAMGLIFPHFDHYIAVYFSDPDSEFSKYAKAVLAQRDFKKFLHFVQSAKEYQRKLIFHTAFFQILFLIFTFLVITSSGNIFGWGLVYGFSIHLIVDQVSDLTKDGNIDKWLKSINTTLDRSQQKWYILANVLLLLVFGLFM